MTPSEKAHAVEAIVGSIRPSLAGQPAEVQGAVLADLLAMFIAGHHPALREEILALHIDGVRKLVAPNEAAIFERLGGKPPGWTPS